MCIRDRNIVIAQNKIELVSDDKVMENYQQIRNFIKNTVVADAPIIPISAIFGANIDVLIQAIEEFIPTPKRDLSKPVRMYVARSFDVNKPGTPPEGLVGGVVGGSILWGQLKVGDEVEIRPGIKITQMGKTRYEPLYSEVVSLKTSLGTALEVAKPGGLIGVGTKLDPSLTKADALAGSVLGIPGTLPETLYSLNIEVHLMERVVGLRGPSKPVKISLNDHLLLNVGTAVTLGAVTELKKDMVSVSLRKPVCVEFDSRVAISKKIEGRWRLIGYGFIRE